MNKEQAIESYFEQFTAFEKTLNGEAVSRVHQLRRDAMQKFSAGGFPTQKDEAWRYTNLNALTGTAFVRPSRPVATAELRSRAEDAAVNVADAITLLFVNGNFMPALSNLDRLPSGVDVRELSAAAPEELFPSGNIAADASTLSRDPFTALNTAFANDGIVVSIRDGAVIDRPLHLLFFSDAAVEAFVAHPRIILQVEANAQCSVIEQYAAAADAVYFNNVVADIRVGENAVLRHVKVQNESTAAFHVASVYAGIARTGTYDNHYIGLGAGLVRGNIHCVLHGEGAHCTINGLYMPCGTQHMDHFTVIDHAVAHCTSHELYKGVLRDDSRGVFTGRIIVRKDAQKTDAKQSNKNLLLSDRAMIDTRPQLEILADDVKCTHGATVGRMDEDQLFYLISRGIDRAQAENILSYAFAGDIVSRVPIADLREALDAHIQRRLEEAWKK